MKNSSFRPQTPRNHMLCNYHYEEAIIVYSFWKAQCCAIYGTVLNVKLCKIEMTMLSLCLEIYWQNGILQTSFILQFDKFLGNGK